MENDANLDAQPTTGRGGARPGAGRPPGSATRKNRDIAARCLAEGISPVEVMFNTMRLLVEMANECEGNHLKIKHLEAACAIAKDAAPYVHPRLTSIQHGGDPDGVPIGFTGGIQIFGVESGVKPNAAANPDTQ